MSMSEPTPAILGYRWPAEWEPHAATWVAWPHQRSDWPGKFAAIPWVYAEIVRHLALSERVNVIVPPGEDGRVRRILKRSAVDLERVVFWPFPTDRVWLRDSGPIFLVGPNGHVAATDWRFNAWAKYDEWHEDDQIPERLGAVHGWKAWQPTHADRRVVLEGGGIDGNGAGLLLTTEEWLLGDTQVRNPGFTRSDYERVFADYLGVTKVLWLGRGVVGDDTHGHVDDLARFVGPRTVVTAVEDDPRDPNHGALRENREWLQGMTDVDGRRLEVVELPMPDPVVFRGRRLPASYANFYVANDRVLVPTFNDPNDRVALGILADLFPGRTVVGIHAVDLVWGFGTLHCLTQQQPAGSGDSGSGAAGAL
jgi:agmatine deiminase